MSLKSILVLLSHQHLCSPCSFPPSDLLTNNLHQFVYSPKRWNCPDKLGHILSLDTIQDTFWQQNAPLIAHKIPVPYAKKQSLISGVQNIQSKENHYLSHKISAMFLIICSHHSADTENITIAWIWGFIHLRSHTSRLTFFKLSIPWVTLKLAIFHATL